MVENVLEQIESFVAFFEKPELLSTLSQLLPSWRLTFPPFVKGGQGDSGIEVIPYNRSLKYVARTLRKNMTDSERLLWSRIRRKQLKGLQFYRQKPIGNYIVDFCCPSRMVIIELDGSQHLKPRMLQADAKRDAELARLGFRVLRYSSADIFRNTDGVVADIWNRLG
jgi:very-short-patch-repair endonuclease